MKNNDIRKLRITRETVRRLNDSELLETRGGTMTGSTVLSVVIAQTVASIIYSVKHCRGDDSDEVEDVSHIVPPNPN